MIVLPSHSTVTKTPCPVPGTVYITCKGEQSEQQPAKSGEEEQNANVLSSQNIFLYSAKSF